MNWPDRFLQMAADLALAGADDPTPEQMEDTKARRLAAVLRFMEGADKPTLEEQRADVRAEAEAAGFRHKRLVGTTPSDPLIAAVERSSGWVEVRRRGVRYRWLPIGG